MDQFLTIVLVASGVMTIIAFSEKIRGVLIKPFKWLFVKPHQDIKKELIGCCKELDLKIEAVSNRQEEKILEMDAMSQGVLAILHDRLFQISIRFIEKGEIPFDEFENLEYMYKRYTKLGGNGACESLFTKVKELKIIR